MSNVPENENINGSVEESAEDIFHDDFSTVFSDPTEHKTSADGIKRKKLLPKIIAGLLAVSVLIGGTVAVIKLIPEKEEEEEAGIDIEDISVLSLDGDDFKTVTVTNTNGTFKLYSVKEKTESDSSDSSDESETVSWYLDGYKDGIISSYSVSGIAGSVADISASREVTQKSLAECGLDKPIITAAVVTSEDTEFSVTIGSESPDKSGYYLKTSDSDKIYVVESSLKETLDFTAVSLANTDSLPAFPLENVSSDYKDDDGNLTSFDKITVTGKNFSEPLVITPNSDEVLSTYAAYMVVSPTKRIADNVDGVLGIFQSGVTVSGAYALDTSAQTLASLGLDKPDLTATMQIGKQSYSFKFSLQSDGCYAVICNDSVIVKKVSADNISFIDYKTSDYYADWVSLTYIDNLKEFTVKIGDKAYVFGIAANTDEDADDSYIITYNGDTIQCSPFQSFYQDCISLACSDYTVDKVSGNPDYTFIYTYKDDIGGSQTIDFVKYSETKYQYSIDGVAMGKVTASSLKSIADSLKELLENG